MRYKHRSFLAVAALLATACTPETESSRATDQALRSPEPESMPGRVHENPSYSPEERAAALVARMTLSEKASQMISSQAAAIPALAIPAYGWWNEAAHGIAREQTNHGGNPPTLVNTTSYPVDLSLGSTWNPELMYREAVLISDEARDVFRENRLDLNFYSPTINLARDPRWGRNDEAFSEDPLLTAAISAQYVNGMEGKDPGGHWLPSGGGYAKVNTTLKHFAANNSEFDRRTGTSNIDERTLREYYTAQFRDAIARSRPASIMSSYNRVNGVPAAASVHLIDTLARETFGFTGFFTSDCDAIREIQAGHHWQPPGYPRPLDHIERHAFALTAGEDLDCNQGYHDAFSYANTLEEAVARSIVTQTHTMNENDLDVAVVRLLAARIRLGEFDDERRVPWISEARARLAPGTWVNSDANQAITETPERLAMARRVADQSIVLLKNRDTGSKDGRAGKLLPLRIPTSGAFRLAVMGPYANPAKMYFGGYSSEQGPAGIAKSVNGYAGVKAAVQAIHPQAVVDFYPGVNPETLAEVDPASVAAAANYDAVIVYAGDDERHSREDVDRKDLALPGAQAALISQVAARNPNTIVYLETVGQVDVGSFEPAVGALLWSSHNGQRKGEALADVLLGKYDPSGHLPFTWYEDLRELPQLDDYGIRPSASSLGRTYMYFRGKSAYPFGFGQSYTTFRYSALRVQRARVDANGTIRVSAEITNTGPVAGDDVVQLYVTTPNAPAALERPLKRLRAFEKVSLRPHETKRVSFSIDVADLAFFDAATGQYAVDTGVYGIQLSSSSADRDIQQQAFVAVSGALRPRPAVVTAKPRANGDAAQGILQRIVFPSDTEIDPRLTVAMADDSLYGYITKGASKPLPSAMKIHYRSNRPDVVSVTGAGVLRTAGSGLATVTVRVEYEGAAAETEFVVYVRNEGG